MTDMFSLQGKRVLVTGGTRRYRAGDFHALRPGWLRR